VVDIAKVEILNFVFKSDLLQNWNVNLKTSIMIVL